MTTTPDPKKVREIARSAFGYLPHDYVRARLVQAAIAEHGIDEHDVPTWSAYFNAAEADLAGAVVSWPDEQSQDEPARPRLFTDIDCDTNPPLRVRAFVNAAMQAPDTNGMGIASVIDSDGVMHVLTEQDLVDVLDDLDETREEFDQLFGERAKEQPQAERDAQLADLATELDAANDDADKIAKQRAEYRKEIMRLRARVTELEHQLTGAQARLDYLEGRSSLTPYRRAALQLENERLRKKLEAAQVEHDGDVRAVAALRAALAVGGRGWGEADALVARFADRIAALEARDAKEAQR